MGELTGSTTPIPIIDPSARDLPAPAVTAYRRASQEARYNYIHYKEIQASHLQASQDEINYSAEIALQNSPSSEPRNALILGAGACSDIPLEGIVERFDTTTLVDVETEYTERVLSTLPVSLLNKVGLVKADISGAAKSIEDVFAQAGEQSYNTFLTAAPEMLRQRISGDPPVTLREKYSFVCSQLVMSQLSVVPGDYFRKMLHETYAQEAVLVAGGNDPEPARILGRYTNHVQRAHVEQLRQLTKPEGVVHLADTTLRAEDSKLVPLVPPTVLNDIKEKFTLNKPVTEWIYSASPNEAFQVRNYSLRPIEQA